MVDDIDKNDESLENPPDVQSEKILDENIPSIEPDNLTLKQQSENMEVHHYPDVEKKNFKAYLPEGLMIFLAVTLGFFAENIRENIVEHSNEKQYIAGLINDLQTDTITLNNLMVGLDSNIRGMNNLIKLLNNPKIKDRSAELYYLARRATRGHNFPINDRTVQQMKNSGGFRLIRNNKASAAIIDYYSMMTFIEMIQNVDLQEQNEYKKIAIEIFDPVIFDSIVLPDNRVIKPQYNPAMLTYDTKQLAGLANMTSYMKGSRIALIRQENDMKQAAKELIELLKKEYHLE